MDRKASPFGPIIIYDNGEEIFYGQILDFPGLTVEEIITKLKSIKIPASFQQTWCKEDLDLFFSWDIPKVKRALQTLFQEEIIECIIDKKDNLQKYFAR
jgi:hypothetical protein